MNVAPEFRKAWLYAQDESRKEIEKMRSSGIGVSIQKEGEIFEKHFAKGVALEDPHDNFPPSQSP